MGSITVLELEVQRLVQVGLLTKGMNFRINPGPAVFLTFCNRLEGRTMYAEISCDSLSAPSEPFRIVVTEVADGQEPELVSGYQHSSLEHLVRIGKGLLCYNGADRKSISKPTKTAVTVRIDEDLRRAFDAAVEATGESQAVVMRQLMRFFIGKGPDPRMIG